MSIVYNKFLNRKTSFWKQENRNYVRTILFFFAYIIKLEPCDYVSCVALELCSKFFQTWFFFLNVLKRYCVALYSKKWEKCLPAMVPMPTNIIYSIWGFYWGFIFVGKTMQNLNDIWIITSISFSFIVWLSCMD